MASLFGILTLFFPFNPNTFSQCSYGVIITETALRVGHVDILQLADFVHMRAFPVNFALTIIFIISLAPERSYLARGSINQPRTIDTTRWP